MQKIGIIGYGNMGSAICHGLLAKGFTFQVAEKKKERCLLLEKECGLGTIPVAKIVEWADLILFAVKPQEFSDLLTDLKDRCSGKQIITVMAGYSLNYFAQTLNTNQLCRFMPNLAAAKGMAAVAVSFSEEARPAFKDLCLEIAQSLGQPFCISERLMPAFTGLSGSGLAFIFAFLHALALGGVSSGIPYPEALQIVLKTTEGALALLSQDSQPQKLITQVASPAGTTIEGLKQLEKGNFNYTVIKAVEEAVHRAIEIEK